MVHHKFDSKRRIWCGEGRATPHPEDVSLGQVILQRLHENAVKVVQICDDTGTEVTGALMRQQSVRVALHLTSLGVGKGDLVTIISRNHCTVAPLVFGCILIGAPINALDVVFAESDIRHMLLLTQPKLICCDHMVIDTVKSVLHDLDWNATPIITIAARIAGHALIDDLLNCDTDGEKEFVLAELGNASTTVVAVMCSSGTTGPPKGVKVTHAQLVRTCAWHMRHNDITLTFSSLYWLTGFSFLVLGTLMGATRIVTTAPASSLALLRLIEKYRITYLFTPPSLLALLLKESTLATADLSSVIMWLSGGTLVPERLRLGINQYLKNGMLVPSYGMTELGSVISFNRHYRPFSVGCLDPEVQGKIVDDSMQILENGVDGEICIKMVTPFMGYLNNDAATREICDKDGWIHTGDVGHFDADGFLYVVDRKKDILKYQGYQISPGDLENIITQMPGVVMVCIVGIPDDDKSSDLIAAVVVRSHDAHPLLTANEIVDYVAQRVPEFKRLRGGVYFLDLLPVTASGKVMRKRVTEIAIKMYFEGRM